MTKSWSKFRSTLRAFCHARRGNVAVTFAFAVIPVIGFIGAAYDYSHANSVKADMQAALDATALMLAKDASSLNQTALSQKAAAYFTALFKHPEATITSTSATYDPTASTVKVSATADVPTTFLRMLDLMDLKPLQDVSIGGSSTTTWGSTRLRVALVLDNTGSMADDGKLAALQSATKSLLTQLQGAATTNGDVYVSIVPFVKDVSVNVANYDSSWESWIDWTNLAPSGSTPSSSVGPGSSCPYSSRSDGYSCVTQAGGRTSTNNIPSSGYICPSNSIGCYTSVAQTTTSTNVVGTGYYASCWGYSNCSCTGSGWSKVCTATTTSTGYAHTWFVDRTKWNGCITDRGQPTPLPDGSTNYDQSAAAPDPNVTNSKFPAEQYSACPQAMLGLSYDWTAMKDLVDNMAANGSTNQPIGLVWGWQTLVGGGPFTAPAMDSNYKYQQAIILLSDGLNTQDRWYGGGSSTSTSVDHRMYDTDGSGTCANIKAAGITIYTIQVNTGGDPTSALLKNCASDSSKFFLLTSSSGIADVFSNIGTQLTKLRVAK